MKFLLDVNISPLLGEYLKDDGHQYRLASTFKSGTLTDLEIFNLAIESDEIIITHDLDFGKLLAFSNSAKPSVILFRVHQINALLFYNLLKQNWNIIKPNLIKGALIVIEEKNIRIRRLPFNAL